MSLLDTPEFQAHIAATADRFSILRLGISYVDLAKGQVGSKGFSFPESEGVTAQTVFQIYSNSKLFTAVTYGILVEEGKCEWSSKIKDLLPDLRMQDQFANETLTVEEILSHQSGLGRGYVCVY